MKTPLCLSAWHMTGICTYCVVTSPQIQYGHFFTSGDTTIPPYCNRSVLHDTFLYLLLFSHNVFRTSNRNYFRSRLSRRQNSPTASSYQSPADTTLHIQQNLRARLSCYYIHLKCFSNVIENFTQESSSFYWNCLEYLFSLHNGFLTKCDNFITKRKLPMTSVARNYQCHCCIRSKLVITLPLCV